MYIASGLSIWGDGEFGENLEYLPGACLARKAPNNVTVKAVRRWTVIVAPQDEPWGERHMAIVDIDGNELHFSSTLGDQIRAGT